ncbi:unnamed protein product [Allacma fusca]|uniref:Uncharacterized protein n=1 Tax=Allacma fusca TaxID=39272 RepID=A0A8J2JNL0_9HEXA|nr:unnamed protein product [Allacma fusca]
MLKDLRYRSFDNPDFSWEFFQKQYTCISIMQKHWNKICFRCHEVISGWLHCDLPIRPVRAELGSFGFVDKTLMLTILDIVASISANLVLTYRYE